MYVMYILPFSYNFILFSNFKPNIIVIVNKLSSNILSPARRFGKVTEYLTKACRGQIFSLLPKPECRWHKYLKEIY